MANNSLFFPDGGHLVAQVVDLDQSLIEAITQGEINHDNRVYMSPDYGLADLLVRSWQPGDAYVPVGRSRAKKLQDLLVNAKIPKEVRHKRPVVTDTGGEILWMPGLPLAGTACILPHDKNALRLTYYPI